MYVIITGRLQMSVAKTVVINNDFQILFLKQYIPYRTSEKENRVVNFKKLCLVITSTHK